MQNHPSMGEAQIPCTPTVDSPVTDISIHNDAPLLWFQCEG